VTDINPNPKCKEIFSQVQDEQWLNFSSLGFGLMSMAFELMSISTSLMAFELGNTDRA